MLVFAWEQSLSGSRHDIAHAVTACIAIKNTLLCRLCALIFCIQNTQHALHAVSWKHDTLLSLLSAHTAAFDYSLLDNNSCTDTEAG